MSANFLEYELNSYCEKHSSDESSLLRKIERETHLYTLTPQMLPGKVQGRLLSFISKMISPEKILEIGTFTGYSALCLAEGLKQNGKLITIEANAELIVSAREYFDLSDYKNRISILYGNALQILPDIADTFDLIYIDASKIEYEAYYDLVFPKWKKYGYMLVDNVLWSSKVLLDIPDPSTNALQAFNKKIINDNRVENVLFPLRDGIQLIRKISP